VAAKVIKIQSVTKDDEMLKRVRKYYQLKHLMLNKFFNEIGSVSDRIRDFFVN
jgi:hypothetical protein